MKSREIPTTVLLQGEFPDGAVARSHMAGLRGGVLDGGALVKPVVYQFSTGAFRTEHVVLRCGDYTLVYSKPICGWLTAYNHPSGPCVVGDFWLYQDNKLDRVLYFKATVWKWGDRLYHRGVKRAYLPVVHKLLAMVRDLARQREWYGSGVE